MYPPQKTEKLFNLKLHRHGNLCRRCLGSRLEINRCEITADQYILYRTSTLNQAYVKIVSLFNLYFQTLKQHRVCSERIKTKTVRNRLCSPFLNHHLMPNPSKLHWSISIYVSLAITLFPFMDETLPSLDLESCPLFFFLSYMLNSYNCSTLSINSNSVKHLYCGFKRAILTNISQWSLILAITHG